MAKYSIIVDLNEMVAVLLNNIISVESQKWKTNTFVEPLDQYKGNPLHMSGAIDILVSFESIFFCCISERI